MEWILPNYKKVGFEDVLNACKNQQKYIIINTLSTNEQNNLIQNTISIEQEEKIINEIMEKYENKIIIVYGKNSCDISVEKKYKQLIKLGLNVYIYTGGLFEWLLLQDIYGKNDFPTTDGYKEGIVDLLMYKPKSVL
jgi:hypothetical protein